MSSLTTLARPYAKAAFELARAQGDLAGWDELLSASASVTRNEAMTQWLKSPHVDKDHVVQIMNEAAGGKMDKHFKGYLGVLAANDRLSLLPEVTALFRRLREDAEKRLRVRVVSAIPLEEDQAERMRAALTIRFEREIELDNEIDTSMLGGAVVYAGDQVIDGSLKGRLENLQSSLA